MAAAALFDDLIAANRRFAAGFAWRDVPREAARGLAVVTCMDTRIDPASIFGFTVGDAKVLRNAGGRVTPDMLRSLTLATAMLGVRFVVVMHHTRCALAHCDERSLRALLPAPQAAAVEWDLLGMPDPDAALAADVGAVWSCASLAPGTEVEGWRYDVDTGLVHRVVRRG